ncbi:MAG: ribonuclease R [Bernardetiaceae bacterium]|nr:ribonuclease R [Bernardetiaceae bacterium]
MARKKTRTTNNKKGRNKRNTSKPSHADKELKRLYQILLKLLDGKVDKSYTIEKVREELNLIDEQVKANFKNMLSQTVDKVEEIQEVSKPTASQDEYQMPHKANDLGEHIGIVDNVSHDYAYIICEDLEQDVRITHKRLHTAQHGDKVRVHAYHFGKSKSIEGEVLEIIERGQDEFVGKVDISHRFAFVICDHKRMHDDIFVPLNALKGAKDGQKVVVKITSWGEADPKGKSPSGEIIRVLGEAGENDVEIHSILLAYGLPLEFEDSILKKAEVLPSEITNEEIAKRRDMRKVTTFTIDPDTAKDFDDAISVEKLDNGNWQIGIHIADVTHYVHPNSLIEKEARKRATSIYLVDRVVPMLPERLSNELCSLRPHEDKLTFSAVFELNEEGKVLDRWFGRTVIYSDRRFTYEEAQEVIETQKGDFVEEILILNKIAKKLQAERFKKGAISFESTEVKFDLDENGKPLGVITKVRKDAHKLVEEFMLLANKEVAEFVYRYRNGKDKNVMVYRTHGKPDEEKIEQLSKFAKRFGYNLDTNPDKLRNAINELMLAIENKPEAPILQQLSIRSMAKAVYSTQADEHFGLAFKHYSHFTSPIRRYPDMMAHRLLAAYLEGKNRPSRTKYETLCRHSSEMEKKSSDAERASIKYKQAEYMSEFIGETFEGIITGITEWGMYIEMIDTASEGMVRLADIEGDYYSFDSKNQRIVGRKYKDTFTYGDSVQVKVKAVDLEKRNIDLTLIL